MSYYLSIEHLAFCPFKKNTSYFSGGSAGGLQGRNRTPKRFDLSKICIEYQKNWAKKFRHFLIVY